MFTISPLFVVPVFLALLGGLFREVGAILPVHVEVAENQATNLGSNRPFTSPDTNVLKESCSTAPGDWSVSTSLFSTFSENMQPGPATKHSSRPPAAAQPQDVCPVCLRRFK